MSTQQNRPIPDPNGPPVLSYCSVKASCKFMGKGARWTVVGAAGGVVALIALGTVATPTMGASRSYHVKWQQRQQDIADAQANEEAPDESPPSLPVEQSND